jgi:hypothetical protein
MMGMGGLNIAYTMSHSYYKTRSVTYGIFFEKRDETKHAALRKLWFCPGFLHY